MEWKENWTLIPAAATLFLVALLAPRLPFAIALVLAAFGLRAALAMDDESEVDATDSQNAQQ